MVYLSIAVLLPVFVVRIVFLAFKICLIGLHVCGHVMRLQMVLILHDEHIVISNQMASLIWNRVVQLIVEVVIAIVILLSRFENVLDLGFEFQLFLQLLLLVLIIHYLLVFDKFLSFILLPYCFINDISFIHEHLDPVMNIFVFKVSTSNLALKVKTAVLVVVF